MKSKKSKAKKVPRSGFALIPVENVIALPGLEVLNGKTAKIAPGGNRKLSHRRKKSQITPR